MRLELEARLEIVIVIARNRKLREAKLFQSLRGGKDIRRRQRDVLDAGSVKSLQEARRQSLVARRAVECEPQAAFRRLDRLTLHQSQRVGDLHGGRLREVKERRVIQQPREHL